MRKLVIAVGALSLLAACEARFGKDEKGGSEPAADSSTGGTTEAKADEGSFSLKAPGVDMKIDIPKGIANNAEIDSDSDLVYPGSKLSGLNIDASTEKNSRVALNFTSPDALPTVVAWYRDPARAKGFNLASIGQEAGAYVVRGTQVDDGAPFTLRLSGRQGGVTEGRLALTDRN